MPKDPELYSSLIKTLKARIEVQDLVIWRMLKFLAEKLPDENLPGLVGEELSQRQADIESQLANATEGEDTARLREQIRILEGLIPMFEKTGKKS